MQSKAWGSCAVMGLVALVSGLSWYGAQADGQQPEPWVVERAASSEGLFALATDTADGRQQIAVIDPASKVMSVYHVEHATGTISLKSVRNIEPDLLMDEFNTGSPLPREIRAMLHPR